MTPRAPTPRHEETHGQSASDCTVCEANAIREAQRRRRADVRRRAFRAEQDGKAAPGFVRNALVKLVTECADVSNARTRGGPRSAGWKGAGVRLGLNFQLLQKVAWGWSVHPSSVARVVTALVREGYLATEEQSA